MFIYLKYLCCLTMLCSSGPSLPSDSTGVNFFSHDVKIFALRKMETSHFLPIYGSETEVTLLSIQLISSFERPAQKRAFLFATMACRLLLFISLLTYNTGFSAEISVFVQTGDSVQLDIKTQELPEIDIFSWTNEKSKVIVKYIYASKTVKHYPSYKDRVDFNNETFSLTLKNMQKTDSGLYRARASGESEEIIVAYRISVIDAVEAPVLTVNSNWSSSDSCSFICKGSNVSISSIYNSSSCSPEEESSSDNYALKLNCSDDYIMCNHTNPVSWKIDRKKVKKLCTVDQGIYEEAFEAFPHWIIAIICSLGLSAALIGFRFYKKKKGAQQNEQTEYTEVDENIKPQQTLEMLKKSEKPHSVYDVAGDSGQPDITVETNHTSPNHESVNQGASLTEMSKPNAPTTIYCAIKKQTKTPKSDSDHTIYAMVSKPPAAYESVHPKAE